MKALLIMVALFGAMAVIFFACAGKDTTATPALSLAEEKVKIQTYLTNNKIAAKALPSGVFYLETKAGVGTAMPVLSSTVTVNYKGYLLDGGTVFDQTPADGSRPIAFQLGGLIKGWQEGIPTMKKSGKTTLFIPSSLGYGSSAQSKIPANSILIFDIELVDFK
jgi:FKBP-type peptidyl-prolyl cis-trans isomerase FkpA